MDSLIKNLLEVRFKFYSNIVFYLQCQNLRTKENYNKYVDLRYRTVQPFNKI